jgi:WD40 repeat protein
LTTQSEDRHWQLDLQTNSSDAHKDVSEGFLSYMFSLSPCRGRAALFNDELVLLSNLKDGVDLYSLETTAGTLVEEIKYNIDPKTNSEVQCAFANAGKWLVVGGNDGYLRIFDRSSTALICELSSGSGCSPAPTISVSVSCSSNGFQLIRCRRLTMPHKATLSPLALMVQ